jgi:hypothetical protein
MDILYSLGGIFDAATACQAGGTAEAEGEWGNVRMTGYRWLTVAELLGASREAVAVFERS